MGLFDHLFKTKSPPGEEKVVDHAPEPAAPKPVEAAPRTPPPQRADPSAFLHPKNFVPRGAPSLTAAPRPGSGISKATERRTPSAGAAPTGDEIVLTLGDVLSRIPTHYLKSGTHDAKRELRFKINDLSSDIARGRAAVPLSRIAQLLPEIFVKEISSDEDTEVRLPLQKLVEQIGMLRSMPKTAAPEKMARPVTTVELPAGIKPVLPPQAKSEPPVVPAVDLPRPAAEQPLAPPIILAEPASVPPVIELKPAAEQTPVPPVVLGPPPAVEAPTRIEAPAPVQAPALAPVEVLPPAAAAAPVVAPVSPTPVAEPEPAPAPAPAPEIPAARPIFELVPPSPEPIPSAAPPPVAPPVAASSPVASPVAPEPQKIILDWGPHVPAPTEEARETVAPKPVVPEVIVPAVVEAVSPEAVVPAIVEAVTPEAIVPAAVVSQPVVEPPRVEPVAEVQKLAPVESPELETGEEKIHLSLAAILRQCPPEIIVGQLPHVEDSVRITLPFAPIDRQLVKGHVEVSALRFIVALPEIYQKYFVAKVGVKVPIPLEEVFQNLPSPKHELKPEPPATPPVFLTFAPTPAAPLPEVAPAVTAPVEKVEEQPAPAAPISEAKIVEPPVSPLLPAEAPKIEAPAIPAPVEELPAAVATPVAPELEVVPPVAAVPPPPLETSPLPPVPPVIDVPAPLTLEKAVPPPLPVAAEAAPSAPEPLPMPSFAASSTAEPLPALPPELVPPWWSASPAFKAAIGASVTDLRPATPPAPASETPASPVSPPEVPPVVPPVESTPAAGEPPASAEAAQHSFHPPVFRPHFIPPPPIFGFAPPPVVVPESEPAARLEPPSVLPGLMESVVAASVPPADNAVLEAAAAPASALEAVAIAVVTDAPAAPVEPPPLPSAEVPPTPTAEVPIETRPDSEPSAELIASAGEHSAPDIAHFSDQPVPYADLAESLAHETTYAPALAEVVHLDASEPKAPVPVEAPAVEPPVSEKPSATEEHPAVAIVEGLAVAAVAATIAEHVPLDLHEAVAVVEEPKTAGEGAAHAEIPAVVEAPAEVVESKVEEPVAAAETVVAEKPAEPEAEAPASPVESAAPAELPAPEPPAAETPEPAAPEAPAAAVPPPPPQPPYLLPKHPAEQVRLEVLPPPARRFDQESVQALFMTEEALDLPKVSRLAAALPGVYACVIATRDQACTGGTLPEGFDLAALLGLAPRVGEAAGRMPIGQLKHFTLYGDAYSVSFFERNGLSLCAVHRPRSFVPGVREKLVALADELSR